MTDPLDYRAPRDDTNSLHDVWAEPHFGAPARSKPEPTVRRKAAQGLSHLSAVWDEPVYSPELGGIQPEDAPTYSRWLHEHRVSAARSWTTALLIALTAGPFAIFGTLFDGLGRGALGYASAILVAPVIEELMKAAAALWVVECKPYLFRSSPQILLCLLASGLGFAAVENLLYLHVYIPDASPELVHWRWTVCVAMHTTCSGIASIGVMRVWGRVMRHRKPARVSVAAAWLTTAAIMHGSYNAFAIWMEMFRGTF